MRLTMVLLVWLSRILQAIRNYTGFGTRLKSTPLRNIRGDIRISQLVRRGRIFRFLLREILLRKTTTTQIMRLLRVEGCSQVIRALVNLCCLIYSEDVIISIHQTLKGDSRSFILRNLGREGRGVLNRYMTFLGNSLMSCLRCFDKGLL